jgi:hypothetical protein
MDEASRMARADQLGYRRNMPLEAATAPADEQIAAAAIKMNGRVFTGPGHYDAILQAERELGIPLGNMNPDPIADGFVTTAGRYVSRREAQEIARRTRQGESSGAFGVIRGLAAEDARMTPDASARADFRTGATAPGLPGGNGVWLRLLSREAPAENALWHRAKRPARMDAKGLSDLELQENLRSAWEQGHDAMMLENYIRPGGSAPETVIVVRDPSQLRLPQAAFDPARRDSADLLASFAGWAPLSGGVASDARQDSPR